ncbi:hypothetical protein TNCV_1193191 [Trichonephila clavipes]|nr:hypothetical protein TNCV_1193191 [Trichonephila clavipes]
MSRFKAARGLLGTDRLILDRGQWLVTLTLGSNPEEGMDVCKRIVPSRHGGTLNTYRAASLLVWLVEGEERWEALDDYRVFSQN